VAEEQDKYWGMSEEMPMGEKVNCRKNNEFFVFSSLSFFLMVRNTRV
jgi:hypothetical protein